MQINSVWWSFNDFAPPPPMEKVSFPFIFKINFNISLLHINVCSFDYPFKLVVASYQSSH